MNLDHIFYLVASLQLQGVFLIICFWAWRLYRTGCLQPLGHPAAGSMLTAVTKGALFI
jgi:hypothetical protein